jgi:O-antigen/teichoic acid export membrane protein
VTARSGGTLAKNSVITMIGIAAPAVLAIGSVPALLRHLGYDRFGILSIFWIVITYFALFDLGSGRALTRTLSAAGREGAVAAAEFIASALAMTVAVSGIGSVLLWIGAPLIVGDVLKMPEAIGRETIAAFHALCLGTPVFAVATVLEGVMAAGQRFRLLALVRLFYGMLLYVGPLAVTLLFNDLAVIAELLIVGRLLCCVVFLAACARIIPGFFAAARVRWRHLVDLYRFGGWVTVTGIVGPVMVYFDRFFVGAMLSTAAIPYYTVPFSLATRLAIIPNGITGVLFPELSSIVGLDDHRVTRLYGQSIKYLFLVYFPLVLGLCLFAKELLTLWIGADFAAVAAPVLQILALGLFVNGIAQIPFTLLQSAGRPDLPAKFHLIELPFYLAVLWASIEAFGVTGTALAWLLRSLADMVALLLAARPYHGLRLRDAQPGMLFYGAATALCIAASLLQGLVMKLLFAGAVLGGFACTSWFTLMTRDEHQMALQSLRRLWRFA